MVEYLEQVRVYDLNNYNFLAKWCKHVDIQHRQVIFCFLDELIAILKKNISQEAKLSRFQFWQLEIDIWFNGGNPAHPVTKKLMLEQKNFWQKMDFVSLIDQYKSVIFSELCFATKKELYSWVDLMQKPLLNILHEDICSEWLVIAYRMLFVSTLIRDFGENLRLSKLILPLEFLVTNNNLDGIDFLLKSENKLLAQKSLVDFINNVIGDFQLLFGKEHKTEHKTLYYELKLALSLMKLIVKHDGDIVTQKLILPPWRKFLAVFSN